MRQRPAVAAARQDPTPAPNGHGPDGVAAMEAKLQELDAELARLDAELAAAERVRDSAGLVLRGERTALESWRAEEDLESASTRISELLEERRPLVERHARVLGHVAPVHRRRREVAELEAQIEVCERLDGVWAHVDAAIAEIDAARPAVARSGRRCEIPPSLEELVRAFGPGSMKRARVESTVGAYALAEMREHLARLKAGLP